MIKVRGWQVSPSELESYLLTHPCIADVGVVGVNLPGRVSEVPSAYVVVKQPGRSKPVTETDIIEYLGSRLSKVKALSGGVRFVESIPRNVSGKILRKELRERAQREFDTRPTRKTITVGKLPPTTDNSKKRTRLDAHLSGEEDSIGALEPKKLKVSVKFGNESGGGDGREDVKNDKHDKKVTDSKQGDDSKKNKMGTLRKKGNNGINGKHGGRSAGRGFTSATTHNPRRSVRLK
jgi:hypothetical protein